MTHHVLAEILGEFDDPRCLDVVRVAQAVTVGGDRQDFGARLITFARLIGNVAWLTLLAALPESSAWPSTQRWIDSKFLIELAKLLDASTSAPATATSAM